MTTTSSTTRTCDACRGRGRRTGTLRSTGERVTRRCAECKGTGTRRVVARRSAETIAADRAGLAETIAAAESWTRAPEGARPADLNALVSDGTIERQVRREFDKVKNSHGAFGGTNMAVRDRAYYRIAG